MTQLSLQQARTHLKQAQQLLEQGKYNQAIELLEQATPVFEEAEDWEGYVQSMNEQSECFWQSAKYDLGIEKAEKALQICLEKWGENNVETANSYNSLGNGYQYKGNYDQAIDCYQKALNIHLVVGGEQNLNTAKSYYNLGISHSQKGDYNQSAAYHQQALDIYLVVGGEQHFLTAKSYNSLGNCYQYKGDYDQAITYYQQALTIQLAILEEKHIDIAGSYNGLGNCFSQKSDYKQAIKYYQQALAIFLLILGEQHFSTAKIYTNLGGVYDYIGDYSRAIIYHQLSLNICLKTIGKYHSSIAHFYSNLGINYSNRGDHDNAFRYYQKAIVIRLALLGEHHPDTAMSYNNLGVHYSMKGDYAQAIGYHQKALSINLVVFGAQHPATVRSYNNLGVVYSKKGDYDQAITYHQQALTIRLTTIGEQHPNTAESYNNLGTCYQDQGNYTQAIAYYQKSITLFLSVLGEKHPSTAQTYRNFANYYHVQSQYPQALHYYQQALQSLALNVPDEDYYPLPKLEGYNSAVELLEVLPAKAATFTALYHQSNNPQDLTAALAHYQCADALIDQMRQSYKTEGSKLVLAEKGKTKVYDAGLAALFDYQLLVKNTSNNMLTLSHFNQTLGYQLPDRPIDLAFHFSEKSKAVLLFAGMKDAEARLNAQLPPDLVQQEYDLRVELTYLERRISEEGYKKDEEQDKTALNEWQSQHFDFKNQYDALIERLETEYPKYYQLKYDLQAANIAQVQTALPPNKAMISYVLADKYLYTIIITAQQSYWLQTDLPADFEGLVEDFLLSFQSKIDIRDYITYGYDLYRHLILPALNTGALQNIQQLIIIPDGILSRVPFEALLTANCTDKTALQDLPYLLQQYQIAYHYSATLWLNQQTAIPTQESENANENAPSSGGIGGGQDFIGFAPIYSNTAQNSSEHDIDLTLPDDFYEKIGIEKPEEKHRINYTETADVVRSVVEGRNFVELIHSETEVRNVAELFAAKRQTAKLLLHEKATLDNFKALVGKYRYILVSAHADYNGEKPDQTGIIFSPNETDGNGIFYMGDAYNLQLQADLVVLSCCETGLGKISKGEGTMALNRGFLYSGAKNVVYTLFKVYDKESCELSTELFRQLIAQKPNAAALHQAKLNLIARGLMPIKWAGYVLVGQ